MLVINVTCTDRIVWNGWNMVESHAMEWVSFRLLKPTPWLKSVSHDSHDTQNDQNDCNPMEFLWNSYGSTALIDLILALLGLICATCIACRWFVSAQHLFSIDPHDLLCLVLRDAVRFASSC